MHFRALALYFLSILFLRDAQATNPIILITIDGLRPDGITKAEAINILDLINTGTSFSKAKTVRPSLTLPAHTSLLTGLDPIEHGITWDDYRPEYGRVKFITVLEIAKRAGFHTAAFVAKDKLLTLNRPNSTNHFELTLEGGEEVANEFERYVIQNGVPDLTFLHLPDPDKIAHVLGWMSPFYFREIRKSDAAVGQIIAVATGAANGAKPTVILTADHGGSGWGHFADIKVHNHIPFIANGEGIESGVVKSDEIRIYDVAPTLLALLSLPIPENWTGKPISLLTKTPLPPQSCLEESNLIP